MFSAFSLLTYDKKEYQFSTVAALCHIDAAKRIVSLDYSSDAFLKDALQAVCLLVEDGLSIVFAHRSFQEYFTACFIADADPETQAALVSKYSRRAPYDNVLPLLYEMRPDVVEQYYILPGIQQLMSTIQVKKKIGITHYTRYIKEAYREFRITGELISGANRFKGGHSISSLVSFALRSCGSLVGWEGFAEGEGGVGLLHEKYGEEAQGEKGLETEGLSYRSEFIRDLAVHGRFFSLNTLAIMPQIADAIRAKHQSRQASLQDILKK